MIFLEIIRTERKTKKVLSINEYAFSVQLKKKKNKINYIASAFFQRYHVS